MKARQIGKLKHLRTIKHHYQKGQGFKHFFPVLENELLKKSHNYFELQLRLIKCILDYLNIHTEIKLGSKESTRGVKERELIINILKRFRLFRYATWHWSIK